MLLCYLTLEEWSLHRRYQVFEVVIYVLDDKEPIEVIVIATTDDLISSYNVWVAHGEENINLSQKRNWKSVGLFAVLKLFQRHN